MHRAIVWLLLASVLLAGSAAASVSLNNGSVVKVAFSPGDVIHVSLQHTEQQVSRIAVFCTEAQEARYKATGTVTECDVVAEGRIDLTPGADRPYYGEETLSVADRSYVAFHYVSAAGAASAKVVALDASGLEKVDSANSFRAVAMWVWVVGGLVIAVVVIVAYKVWSRPPRLGQ